MAPWLHWSVDYEVQFDKTECASTFVLSLANSQLFVYLDGGYLLDDNAVATRSDRVLWKIMSAPCLVASSRTLI